jgi:LmbE family N-acetylglucosaminyl deacetylase
VERLFFYPGNHPFTPSFLVKISAFIDQWERAVLAYRSQFSGEAASETVGPKGVEARKAMRRYFGNYLGGGLRRALHKPPSHPPRALGPLLGVA